MERRSSAKNGTSINIDIQIRAISSGKLTTQSNEATKKGSSHNKIDAKDGVIRTATFNASFGAKISYVKLV